MRTSRTNTGNQKKSNNFFIKTALVIVLVATFIALITIDFAPAPTMITREL